MKEDYGDAVEFSDADGKFDLNDYADQHQFEVVSQNDDRNLTFRTPATSLQPSTSTPSSSSQRRAAPLTTVKVVRADLGANGKPCNFNILNMASHINIYREEDACVAFIEERVRQEMGDETLKLVGTTGLVYYEQEGTTGNKISLQGFLILNVSIDNIYYFANTLGKHFG